MFRIHYNIHFVDTLYLGANTAQILENEQFGDKEIFICSM